MGTTRVLKALTLSIEKDIAMIVLCPHSDCVMQIEIPYDAMVCGLGLEALEEFWRKHMRCNLEPRDE